MRRLLILCNALDDATRLHRGITTDSPAASRKIFMAARAIGRSGVVATIVSLGRGRGTGDNRWFSPVVRRCAGVLTCYLPFTGRPVVSQLLSLFAAAVVVGRQIGRKHELVILVYNRAPAYVLAMVVARLRGIPVVLDLEDGHVAAGATLRDRIVRLSCRLFDRLCGGRALLACTALAATTRLRPTMVYYGIAESIQPSAALNGDTVSALMGGSVDASTGGDLLVATIEALRRDAPEWATKLSVDVTGRGASLAPLAALAAAPGDPVVRVWGRTTDADYAAIRDRSDVGLALKPNHGVLAQTTFPSKVMEIAASGQLVLTTDISDVREVFGDDGAVFLTEDSPAALSERLAWIVANPGAAREIADRGRRRVAQVGNADVVGRRLAAFLFGRS